MTIFGIILWVIALLISGYVYIKFSNDAKAEDDEDKKKFGTGLAIGLAILSTIMFVVLPLTM